MNEEALKFLQSYYDSCQPEYKVIEELLTSRQTIKRLVDDAKALAILADGYYEHAPYKTLMVQAERVINEHNTLMQEIGVPK